MSIFSRSRSNAVTASAMVADRGMEQAIRRISMARRDAQVKTWTAFDRLAEVHYPTTYIGNAIRRFEFPVGRLNPADVSVQPHVPEGNDRDDLYRAAVDIMYALEGPLGDVKSLGRLYAMNDAISGEGYLVGEEADDTWEYLSVLEIVATQEGRWKRNGLGVDAASDVLGDSEPAYVRRMWSAHPGRTMVADSPLFSLQDDCNRLIALNESMTARILNRMAQAGILFLPSGLSVVGAIEAPDGSGTNPVKSHFWVKLLDTMEKAILNRNSASGAIPIILEGAPEAGEQIRHIVMDRTIDRVEMELRAELRNNLATGQNLPPEVQQGLGDANHFSTWSIGDSTYQSHLLPIAQDWAQAVTRTYLWPALRLWVKDEAAGRYGEEEIRELVVFADGAHVVTRPNASEDARQLHDRLAISNKVLREKSGHDDDDAPEDDEYVRHLGVKINNPFLATLGLPIHDTIDWEMVAKVPNGEGSPGIGGTPPSRRPADSSDPAGAPGEGEVSEPDQAAIRAQVFGAAASGHVHAARKAVGAQLRGLAASLPHVAAEIKNVPNEKVLAAVDLDELDLSVDDVRAKFTAALAPLVADLSDHDPVDVARFVDALAAEVTTHASKPLTFAACQRIAQRVLCPPAA